LEIVELWIPFIDSTLKRSEQIASLIAISYKFREPIVFVNNKLKINCVAIDSPILEVPILEREDLIFYCYSSCAFLPPGLVI
jgi:hypothetical protein